MFNYDELIKRLDSPSWSLYKDLISECPKDDSILDAHHGPHWNFIETKAGLGVSHFFKPFEGQDTQDTTDLIGKSTDHALELIFSWNFNAAAYGIAAVNACLNTPKQEKHLNAEIPASKKEDAISKLMPKFKGGRVAVIGHFPKVEVYAANHELYVLELNPSTNVDVFTSASEYLLPSCDLVIMTGMTLANKTAPRLLELSKNACTAMVGPSVPVSDVLFDYGVDIIGSSVAHNIERTKELILDPSAGKLFGEAFRNITVIRPGFTW